MIGVSSTRDDDDYSHSRHRQQNKNDDDTLSTLDVILGHPHSPEAFSEHRNKPLWARLPDESTEYSDWQIDVTFTSFLQKRTDDDDDGDNDGDSDCDGDGDGDDSYEEVGRYDYPSEEFSVRQETGESKSDDCDKVFLYRVHRYIIGPQSDYFRSVFNDKDETYPESRCSIEFPVDEDTCISRQYFEDLLDFLYDPRTSKKLKLRFDKALAMLYFADFFGIRTVREQSLKYIRHHLSRSDPSSNPLVDEKAKIYIMAESLSIEELQDTVASRCHYLYPTLVFRKIWLRLRRPDLQKEFLHRICRERETQILTGMTSWSNKIASVVSRCPDLVDKDLFRELTDKTTLPEIETVNSVLILLKHEHKLGLDEPHRQHALTCLQTRCIDQIYDATNGTWRISKYPSPKEVLEELRELKPSIMETLLLRTMERNTPKFPKIPSSAIEPDIQDRIDRM